MKSILSKYLGHLAGYVGSAIGIVAAVDPTFLPPVGKLTVASAALLVGVAHHSYTAGTLAGAVNAATNALAKVPAAAAVALLTVLALGTTTGLTGCSTVQAFFASPTGPVVVTVGVDVAVAAAEQHGVKASDINRIAKIALAANASTSASLGAVAQVVNAEITTLNLPPLDLAAAQALEAVVQGAVQAKLTNADGTTNANLAAAQADVAQVLQAVITATGG